MPADARLASIPKGMTCAGVHRAIVESLLKEGGDLRGKAMLDLPCGRADLIESLKTFFPEAIYRGCDLTRPTALTDAEFTQVDATRLFRAFPEIDFHYFFCVSGLQEFDDTFQFLKSCANHLAVGGKLFLSVDNTVAMGDRISYFFFGRVRQYRLFLTQDQPCWRYVALQNIVKMLRSAGFEIREVTYLHSRWTDWLLLPLALLVYPIQYLYLLIAKSKMPISERVMYYPFRSMFCRHYIMVCEKIAG